MKLARMPAAAQAPAEMCRSTRDRHRGRVQAPTGPRNRETSRWVSSPDGGMGDLAASASTMAARWSRASSRVVMMSESTASKPARIRSRTASMSMGELGDRRQAHHGRGPLQAVGRPKGLVEVRTVALTPLQIHQSLFETDQELARFLEKHLPESVVRTAAQIPRALFSSAIRCHDLLMASSLVRQSHSV